MRLGLSRYRERRLKSLGELRASIQALEFDEGIRLAGTVASFRRGGFIFITKKREQYCVNICEQVFDEKARRYVPGGKEEWRHFATASDAFQFAIQAARKPLRAWVY